MHRLRYHYADAVTSTDTLLTIETSLRTSPREETVEIVDGIRTYTIPQIMDQGAGHKSRGAVGSHPAGPVPLLRDFQSVPVI